MRAPYLRERARRANERAAAVARAQGNHALAERIAARERAAAEAFIARSGAAHHAQTTAA